MKTFLNIPLMLMIHVTAFAVLAGPLSSQTLKFTPELDRKVEAFLQQKRNHWYDMNVPWSDGKLLYDLIIENGYTKALEIGTSTGHSGVWIAWALAKTGGRLITIEIDERRHRIAVENFNAAGLSEYVDARLDDAHELVKELEGPFDFVFSDADKGWYRNYFLALDPKLEVGGCYATHNVTEKRRYGRRSGTGSYLEFLKSLPHYETTVDENGSGMAVSYKKSEKEKM
jgi:predicted O-methyltransferase YrrM